MKKSRRHAYGQHFLVNRSVLSKIVDTVAPDSDDTIVEVGAGRGNLTALLAERAGRVIAIEKDERLLSDLRKQVPENVHVIHADVLAIDLRRLLEEKGAVPCRAIGNLPYAISTPFLFKVIEWKTLISDCVFLLQKEVADRVSAAAGSRAYSPLSFFLQNVFDVRILFQISPGSFAPPPKVHSSLLFLRRRPTSQHKEAEHPDFRIYMKSSFAHRRKQLRNNLARLAPGETIEAAFIKLSIAQNVRADELTEAQFVELYHLLRPHFRP